jgi:SPASM domain peptide maturase of grasp-with-spasm system
MIVQDFSKWFKLFASCKVVHGSRKSLVYDLGRSAFYEVPHSIEKILADARTNNIGCLEIKYEKQFSHVMEILDQFVGNELGFYTNDPESFPEIDFGWQSPYTITNAIVEIEDRGLYDFIGVANQLDELSCRAIQLRFLKPYDLKEISALLGAAFSGSRINQVELIINSNSGAGIDDLIQLLAIHQRINKILVYNSAEDYIVPARTEMPNRRIVYCKKDLNKASAEIIHFNRFYTNIQMFAEAQKHNIGLNRKVCIDYAGNIKNYLSHHKIFGNVRKDLIKEIIEKPDFREKWFYSNDQLEVCKDCQYRYACLSNSDIKSCNNRYYKVDMCDFNPGDNSWK